MKRRILVISQDLELRATAARNLQSAGYAVELAENDARLRGLIKDGKIDPAILALSSSGAIGPKLATELRGSISHVIVLVASAAEAGQLAGSLPDVTVVQQPLDWPQLLHRMSEHLTQADELHGVSETSEMLGFEGRTVDLTGHAFYGSDGVEVSLTRAEFQLLTIFIRKPARVLSRDQLRNALDNRSGDPYDRAIDMLVARLRRKIEPDPKAPRFILTVPGAGYKFAVLPHRIEPAATQSAPRREPRELSMSHLERRQVTVVACQIGGILALSKKHDPEAMHAAKDQVGQVAANIAQQFGGTVVRIPGDRLLFYFGYPDAQENDAEQAVRAALEMVRAMPGIKVASSTALHMRVGIATGLLLVGGADSSQNHTATGEPLNVALHLISATPADGVTIAASTRELLGRLFDFKKLKPIVLEEGLDVVPIWRVIGESASATGRFEALRRFDMIDLVGRDEQMALLLRRWRQAQRGAGQVVMLTGEPGIGKSRLVTELEHRIAADRCVSLKYYGLPHQIDASMFATAGELQVACGFERSDSEPEKLRKLEAILDASGVSATKTIALMAELLSLPAAARQSIAQLTPQARKKETLAALLARIKGLATRQPVLVIVEDIHWIDPASLEFLSLLVEHIADLPILMLVAARPGFATPWSEHAYVTVVELPRLGRSDAELLVERVAGDVILPKDVMNQILAPTEGVPLFIEELTKTLLETGELREGKMHYQFDGGNVRTIPRTLQGSLLARLDRLHSSKQVAQIGAVIGREFSHELLCAVAAMPEPALRSALDQLGASGLMYRRGAPPLATYVFKHALVRDAAYDMLSGARKRELHSAIARALEESFPDIAQTQPELLAHHYKEANNLAKGVEYLSIASERALSHSALTESHTHIMRALQLISGLPDDDSRRRQELKLRIALARTLLEQKGYADKLVGAAYSAVHEFSERIKDSRGQLAGLYGMWAHHYIRGEPKVMLGGANEFLRFAIAQKETAAAPKETGPIVVGYRLVGTSRLINGDIAGATDALEKALVEYAPGEHCATSKVGRDLRARFGQDVGVTIYSYRSWAMWLSGRPDQAAAAAKSALDQARALKHDDQSLFYALWHAGLANVLLRNVSAVTRLGDELNKYANERALPYWQALASFLRGWRATQSGRPVEAIEVLQHGLKLWNQTGSCVFRPICLAFLAEAYAAADRRKLALDTFDEALRIAAKTGERWAEPEIRRLFGEALVHGKHNRRAEAINQFTQANALARQQGALSFELRATTSLVRALSNQDDQLRWHNRLSELYRAFSEGLDTADLTEARTLLATEAVP